VDVVSLQQKKVLEIRARKEAGARAVLLADEFGVTANTITTICSGKAWKHVE
jgi:hypothetical protein